MRACFHQLQPTPLVEKRQDSPVGSAAVFFGGVIDELGSVIEQAFEISTSAYETRANSTTIHPHTT